MVFFSIASTTQFSLSPQRRFPSSDLSNRISKAPHAFLTEFSHENLLTPTTGDPVGKRSFVFAEEKACNSDTLEAFFGCCGKRVGAMAEEENRPSPRTRRDSMRNRDSDFEFNRTQPGRMDRKSLAGMSESVKAILAPLLGGKKSHSKVEVDMGQESDAAYEHVDTGSTAMQRYSTVEVESSSAASSPGATASSNAPPGGMGGDTSATLMTQNNSRTSDVLGPQGIKGKYEEKLDTPARIASPIDLDSVRVDNFDYIAATKPKMKEYEQYLTETAPELRARVDSILADTSHEAGFERKLPDGGLELPNLEPEPEEEPPSLMDRVKDTLTGQVPGHGSYFGKATIDEPGLLRPSRQSEIGYGRVDRDDAREYGVEGIGMPEPNPKEDHHDDNMNRLRGKAAAMDKRSFVEGDEAPAIVTHPEGGVPFHPTSSASNPQVAPTRRKSMPRGSY